MTGKEKKNEVEARQGRATYDYTQVTRVSRRSIVGTVEDSFSAEADGQSLRAVAFTQGVSSRHRAMPGSNLRIRRGRARTLSSIGKEQVNVWSD